MEHVEEVETDCLRFFTAIENGLGALINSGLSPNQNADGLEAVEEYLIREGNMNSYDMVLYWQNKALVMEKEVRKAQKGIARLKRKERKLMMGHLKMANQNEMLQLATKVSEETIKRNIGICSINCI